MRLSSLLVAAAVATTVPQAPDPQRPLRFAVIGNSGLADDQAREVASQLHQAHAKAPLDLVITTGGNVDGTRPQDFAKKFQEPFAPLLSAGVPFRAALGDKDSRESVHYKPFNMGGRAYYSHQAPRQDVRFFAIDTALDPAQLVWLDGELGATKAWKFVHMHRPIYSSAAKTPTDAELKAELEPLFVKHRVAFVFAGRDGVYERIRPQQGIIHFVVGSSGKLDRSTLKADTGLTLRGFDQDHVVLFGEVAGGSLRFTAVRRNGEVVDSGVAVRR